jgi:hypothetical protein
MKTLYSRSNADMTYTVGNTMHMYWIEGERVINADCTLVDWVAIFEMSHEEALDYVLADLGDKESVIDNVHPSEEWYKLAEKFGKQDLFYDKE